MILNTLRLERASLQFEYNWGKSLALDLSEQGNTYDYETLNRKNGYEVLAFINRFMIKYALFYNEEGKKIEELIQKAPRNIETVEAMTIYIIKNW